MRNELIVTRNQHCAEVIDALVAKHPGLVVDIDNPDDDIDVNENELLGDVIRLINAYDDVNKRCIDIVKAIGK